jgi:two-component system nitrogen regulation sensor histidine kinase GlnL
MIRATPIEDLLAELGLGAGVGVEALDQLATMIAVVRADGRCMHANTALEDAMGLSRRLLQRASVSDWVAEPAPLREHLARVAANEVAVSRFDAMLKRPVRAAADLPVHVIISQLGHPGERGAPAVLLELIEIEQQTRQDREERHLGLWQANKELVRNLAHEIKNPLGGIRGAAQLLALEVESRELKEYTQVIIQEADRLQALVDRLLAPHRHQPVVGDVNIHEVCERVRSLVLAEHPRGLEVQRDYDISIPEFRGDREQLIQALLNVVHNAGQALAPRIEGPGGALIRLTTRIARQVTIGRQRWRLALELRVQDNGPGVPEPIRDRIFQPLVSGREGGSGLGLTLAQSLVQQHEGTIECESAPGRTVFKILIPLP